MTDGGDRQASPGSVAESGRGTARVSAGARLVIAVMRGVPALFVLSLCALGAIWVAGGRATAGLALIAAAAGAATFGVRILLATRLEVRSRCPKR